ncbi:MAG TPA: hypothetical protein PLX06_01025 [Fimbriimonadaceae bacterium]|nr:hypothetical protein [Fimbriimonadaceae bacterium]
MQRDTPNWIPFIIGGSCLEGIGLIAILLATRTDPLHAGILALGIMLLAIGGLGTTVGIIKAAAAKKGR